MLDNFCFLSKNLYNYANYQIRQVFVSTGLYVSYNNLDKILKMEDMNNDYKNMPTAQSAQQLLKLLDKNWKSFFKSIKDWKVNPAKYLGRPKLPKYLKKDGRNILVLTNQNCKLVDGIINFPKVFGDFKVKTNVDNLQQVRFLPRNKHIILELVYAVETPSVVPDNGRYYGIDMGLDNFVTVVNNFGEVPIVINGKGLKSINQYYNKAMSHYREIAKRVNGLDYTTRMNSLTIRRNNKVEDFIHKASCAVINYAVENNVSVIVVGNNKQWKNGSKMSKKVNQKFVSIPHQKFIEKLLYKAENVGIKVIPAEESYTSKASFLDGDNIPKWNKDNKIAYSFSGKRIKRGLYKSFSGVLINADVNGAYNILRKVFPKLFEDGIEGVGLHPVRVGVI